MFRKLFLLVTLAIALFGGLGGMAIAAACEDHPTDDIGKPSGALTSAERSFLDDLDARTDFAYTLSGEWSELMGEASDSADVMSTTRWQEHMTSLVAKMERNQEVAGNLEPPSARTRELHRTITRAFAKNIEAAQIVLDYALGNASVSDLTYATSLVDEATELIEDAADLRAELDGGSFNENTL